MMANINH